MQLLLQAGASPSVTNCHGQTLLHLALLHGVRPGRQPALGQRGNSAAARHHETSTVAGREGLKDLLRLLTHHGANLLDRADNQGLTALHIAAGLPLWCVTDQAREFCMRDVTNPTVVSVCDC